MLCSNVASWYSVLGVPRRSRDVQPYADNADIHRNRYNIKTPKNIQGLASIFFVVAGVLMADSHYHFFQPMFSNYADYIEILYNKWVVLLLIAAVIEVYTTHRIDHELSKKI